MANKINIGNINISSVKLGTADVSLYLGDNKLYPLSTPTFDRKWLATYSDSHTESAQCDASSAITENEITKENLVSAEIGDCVTNIDNRAFSGCTSLTSVTIPSSVIRLGFHAFYNCTSLTSIDIPNSVTTIGGQTFEKCTSLTSIDIPNSVTGIGGSAFYNCTSLTSVTIGSGVTRISNYAFQNCISLDSITCLATTPPTLVYREFYNTNNCPIYVPARSVSAYQSAWSDYASRIQAIPNS